MGAERVIPELQSEREVIACILEGDPQRYYELIAPLERRIYFTAFEILGVEADAEEVAQEAILKAFRNLDKFRYDSRFSTWLFSITINEARMRLRKRREVNLQELQDGENDNDYVPLALADWREIPLDTVLKSEMAGHLAEAIAHLQLPYREVLVLRDINGVTTAEAAHALGLSLANVKTRLLRARLMLRDYFVSHRLITTVAQTGREKK